MAGADASNAQTVSAAASNRFTALSPSYGWITTLKSMAVSALLPNWSHALHRPVLSHERACQRYPVLLVSPPTCTDVCVPPPPADTKSLAWVATPVNGLPIGSTSTSSRACWVSLG